MSCKKAQGFLESNELTASAITDAAKERKGPKDALALARQAARIVVAKGKKRVIFDMKKDPPGDDVLLPPSTAGICSESGSTPTVEEAAADAAGGTAESDAACACRPTSCPPHAARTRPATPTWAIKVWNRVR